MSRNWTNEGKCIVPTQQISPLALQNPGPALRQTSEADDGSDNEQSLGSVQIAYQVFLESP